MYNLFSDVRKRKLISPRVIQRHPSSSLSFSPRLKGNLAWEIRLGSNGLHEKSEVSRGVTPLVERKSLRFVQFFREFPRARLINY